MKQITAMVKECEHPLVQHKISQLRRKDIGNSQFRQLVEEIAMLMGYEALQDLPVEFTEIQTPLELCQTPVLSGKKPAIVPILRAGLGMVNGILSLIPSAKIGHIGLYRDHETHEPHEYYCKLPKHIDQRLVILVDPMLATGRFRFCSSGFYQTKRMHTHQIFVRHCCARRCRTAAESTPGY